MGRPCKHDPMGQREDCAVCFTPWPTDAQFNLGDKVQKKGRASWRGTIVGWYRTELTALGYAVESSFEPGSVQIYPESALLPWDDA